jgi:transposase
MLEPVERPMPVALSHAPVRQHDETGVRRAGKLAGAHVTRRTRTRRLTPSAVPSQRGHEAMDAMGLLPRSQGVSVHDGGDSSGVSTACRQARCQVHHVRALPLLEAAYPPAWAADLKALVHELKTAADQARSQGPLPLASATRADWLERCQALLDAGRATTPPPPEQERRPGHRGRLTPTPARHLLARLLLQRDEVLACLDDLAMPCDNHQAERDLRDRKGPHTVAGGFRRDWGADASATIRGYLATRRTPGHALLAALETVFAAQPLSPASA